MSKQKTKRRHQLKSYEAQGPTRIHGGPIHPKPVVVFTDTAVPFPTTGPIATPFRCPHHPLKAI